MNFKALSMILLCAVALLFTIASAFSQEQSIQKSARIANTESTKETSATKSHKTSGTNLPVSQNAPAAHTKVSIESQQPVANVKPGGEQRTEKKEEGWWPKLVADPITVFTCLLFVATLLLWWTTRSLVRGADQNAKWQLRAYISSKPDFIWNFSSNSPARMRYTIENHGQTPAYALQNVAAVYILPYPLPTDFQLPPLPTTMAAPMTLNPRETIFGNVTAQRTFTAQEISDAANNNGCRIYCYGIVQYKSFGVTHTTKFCRSIVGCQNLQSIGSGIPTPQLNLNYEIASHHNEAN